MAEARDRHQHAKSQRQAALRQDWARRLLNELFALFVALLVIFAGLLVLLDSAPGHRFIVDQLSGFETASGLRIRIGRIDGSIFGKSQLRNVTVADSRGVFLTSPNIKLDWTPGGVAGQQAPHRQPDRAAGHADPPAQAQAEHRARARSCPASTSMSAISGSTGSTSARRSAAGPQRERSAARRMSAPGARWSSSAAVMPTAATASLFHLDAEPDRDKFDALARVIAARRRAGSGDDRHQPGDQSRPSAARAAGRAGAAPRRSISRAARRRGSRSASTAAATGSRVSGRQRSSSPASSSA